MISRRQLGIALAAGALAATFSSFAQQKAKLWRIGFPVGVETPTTTARLAAFKAGMSALGYVEGKDYLIEFRNAQSDIARLPVLVAELVAMKVDIIIVGGTPTALAASRATSEIPILITTIGDPVGLGLAHSLAKPGGNVTGFTSISVELVTKRLDLLRQLLPRMRRVGLLYDPDNQSDALGLEQFEADCTKLQLHPIRAGARKTEDLAGVFKKVAHDKAQGLIVTATPSNNASRDVIIEHAAKYRLPAIYSRSDYAEAGGLISYGPDYSDLFRRTAAYVDKIFKGAKPGDLPIERPNKFDLLVNMRTAKDLGIKIASSILVQATNVIE